MTTRSELLLVALRSDDSRLTAARMPTQNLQSRESLCQSGLFLRMALRTCHGGNAIEKGRGGARKGEHARQRQRQQWQQQQHSRGEVLGEVPWA